MKAIRRRSRVVNSIFQTAPLKRKVSSMNFMCRTLALLVVSVFLPVLASDNSEKPILDRQTATGLALKAVPGKIINWCVEIDNGVPIFSFNIKAKNLRISEVEVNGNSGEIDDVGIEIERGSAGSIQKTENLEDLARLKDVKLSRERAEKRALLKFSGKVEGWELEFEEGRLVYEFLITHGAEKKIIGVDARNGSYTEITRYVEGTGF